jgi:HPr kinase/phosphorylase
MAQEGFSVLDLLDLDLKEHNALDLVCIAGRKGLTRKMYQPDLNRPGLALSGFFDDFAFKRLQLFGRGECAYLEKLAREDNWSAVERIFTFEIPCCIFTSGARPHPRFLEIAEEMKVPVLQTALTSSEFSLRIIRALSNIFAASKTIHGVLVEVSGMGVLILGDSGVGKSETALELIERGHRLVCDDAVEIRCVSGNILMGKGTNQMLGHHLEVRGVGIINIAQMFGIRAIREKKQIQMVMELELWNPDKDYERLGTHVQTMEILGVGLPYMRIPVKPGRNMAILIETAAMNERLKKLGYFSAQEFNQNVIKWLESENARSIYLQKNQGQN